MLAADVDRRWAENEDAHRLELAAVTLERDRYLETVNACYSFQREQVAALAAKDEEIAALRYDLSRLRENFELAIRNLNHRKEPK